MITSLRIRAWLRLAAPSPSKHPLAMRTRKAFPSAFAVVATLVVSVTPVSAQPRAEQPAPRPTPAVASRTMSLYGDITNTTVDASSKARLTLSIEGENVVAILKTEPPLSGSGRLEGKFRNGWCELSGKTEQGFQLQFRGVLNAQDFRGTYLAAVPGEPIQYGKFQLALEKK